jgi:hypothetical protein
MNLVEPIFCPSCGAAIPPESLRRDIAVCSYCRVSFRVSNSLTPEPDLGDLILGADFHKSPILGWSLLNEDRVSFPKTEPPQLRASFPPSEQVHYVLHSAGVFENFDASVTIRFEKGSLKHARAGFLLRYNLNLGGYVFFISPQSTYMIGWYDYSQEEKKLYWAGELVDWTENLALRHGFAVDNRLRVVMAGAQMRVYLNGVLATAIRDERHVMGQIRLALEPTQNGRLDVSFMNLQVREVPPQLRRRME